MNPYQATGTDQWGVTHLHGQDAVYIFMCHAHNGGLYAKFTVSKRAPTCFWCIAGKAIR